MPKRQERDVLLSPLHTAHMCSIHAHSFSDGLLAEAGLCAKSSKIVPEHLSNIHPKDGHQSRILALRIIIRGAPADPFRPPPQFRKHSPSTRENLGKTMPSPPAPPIAETAPTAAQVTDYDRAHLPTYLRLLDATSEGAPWEEVARVVLDLDPALEPDRARRAHETHLARARWLTEHGYRDLLRSAR